MQIKSINLILTLCYLETVSILLSAEFGWLCDEPREKHVKCTYNVRKRHQLILRHVMTLSIQET